MMNSKCRSFNEYGIARKPASNNCMLQSGKFATAFQALILLLLFCATTNFSFAQTDSSAKSVVDIQSYSTYSIRGFVFDFDTGEPVVYAPVAVISNTDTAATYTNEEGLYVINIKADFCSSIEDLQLQSKYIGYLDTTITELPFEKNTATLMIELKRDPDPVKAYDEPAPKTEIIKLSPEMIKRIPDPKFGPPMMSIEIIRDADFYRTETMSVADDEF